MRKIFKKTLSAMIAVVMVLSAAPLSGFVGLKLPSLSELFNINAEAATYNGTCGDNLTWTLDTETGVLTISGTGDMTNYDYTNQPWYSNRSYIKSVVISDSVTSIGNFAFYDCTNIIDLTIGDSVTDIGSRAFDGCIGLTEINYNAVSCADLSSYEVFYDAGSSGNGITVNIGANVEKIPAHLFCQELYLRGAKIIDVVFEENSNCVSIGDYAFACCPDLKNIAIPESVVNIGEGAFFYCTSLTDITIPDSVTSIDNRVFEFCTSLKSITIPNSVTNIGSSVFQSCWSLVSVTLSDSVTSISDNAFRYCNNLTSITIPDSITSIGGYAFEYCSSLTSITIPNSVTSIGELAFIDCTSLEDVYYTGSQSEWNEISIYEGNDPLLNATIHFVGVPHICEFKFSYYQTEHPHDAVYKCSCGMEEVRSEETTVVETCEFCILSGTCGDNLTWTLNIKTMTLTISGTGEMKDFYSSSSSPWYSNRNYIKSVIISDGVTRIGSWAFGDCSNLSKITVPCGITSIGGSAFYNTAYYNDSSNWENDVLYLGSYLISAKESLSNIYETKRDTTVIADFAFSSCKKLTSIIISDRVTSIGWGAFEFCDNLTSIKIPDSVTVIGSYAFDCCESLVNVTIPNSVTNIEEGTFIGCTSLEDVYYTGSQSEWNEISINAHNNDPLQNATIHYHYGEECDFCEYLYSEESHPHYAVYKCSKCDKTLTSEANYTEVIDSAVAPTCTETGLTEGSHCSVCGETIVAQGMLPATGHSYGAWKVVTPAEPGVDGKEERICSVCGEKEEKTITALPVELIKIEIISEPYKTEFIYKASVDKSGLQVVAYYNNGDEIDVTDKVNVTCFDTNSIGDKTATIEFEGQTATFDYSVSYAWWQWIIRILLLGFIWY